MVEVVVQRLQRPRVLRAAQTRHQAAGGGRLQSRVEPGDRLWRMDIQGDDRGSNRDRRGGPGQVREPLQVADLPTRQPDCGVPQSLQLSGLIEMAGIRSSIAKQWR